MNNQNILFPVMNIVTLILDKGATKHGHKDIVIKQPYWNTLGDYGREQLIFHELGHCALNRDHDNNKDIYDCPMSIMYQFTFGDTDCYPPYRNELLQELING